MIEAEKIAKGLTEAMRDTMVRIRDWPSQGSPVSTIGSLNRNTFRALERRGLVSHHMKGMIGFVLLTPLGLAVRKFLEAEKEQG